MYSSLTKAVIRYGISSIYTYTVEHWFIMHLKKNDKPTNPYQKSGNKNLVRFLLLSIIGLVALIVYLQTHAGDSNLVKSNEQDLKKDLARHVEKEKHLSDQLKEAHEEKLAAEQSRHELELQLRGSKDKHGKASIHSGGETKDVKEMQNSMDLIAKKIDKLEVDMQKKAKKEIIAKWVSSRVYFTDDEEIIETCSSIFANPLYFMCYF